MRRARVHAGADTVRELARRQLRCVDLLDIQVAGFPQPPDVQPHVHCAVEQQAELLIEDEQGRPLAARHRSYGEL